MQSPTHIDFVESHWLQCADGRLKQLNSIEKRLCWNETQWREDGRDLECGVSGEYILLQPSPHARLYAKTLRSIGFSLGWELPPRLEQPQKSIPQLAEIGAGDQIAGYSCKKAVLRDGSGEWEIQYAEQLAVAGIPGHLWMRADGVPGMILEKRSRNAAAGTAQTHYRASRVGFEAVKSAQFTLPGHYERFPSSRAAMLEDERLLLEKLKKTPGAEIEVKEWLGTWVGPKDGFLEKIIIGQTADGLGCRKEITPTDGCGEPSVQIMQVEVIGSHLLLRSGDGQALEHYQYDAATRSLRGIDSQRSYQRSF